MNPILDEIKVDGVLHSLADKDSREKIADILKYKTMTKEQMLNVVDDDMPDTCSTFCSDDNSFYIYNKSNELNEETGKFVLYQNLTIDELSDTPYVFVKPSSIILTMMPEKTKDIYSLDNICEFDLVSCNPTITFSNDFDSYEYTTTKTLSLGDEVDLYGSTDLFIRSKSKFLKFTTASDIYSFGEPNENNIRKITLKSTSGKRCSDATDAFKFCSHLPPLTDFVDDASVTQEGYIIRYQSYLYVDLYISNTRPYCATQDAFGEQLAMWSNEGKPLCVGYKLNSEITTTGFKINIPLYLNGNYNITTDYPDICNITVKESKLESISNVLVDIYTSLKNISDNIDDVSQEHTNIDGGVSTNVRINGMLVSGKMFAGPNCVMGEPFFQIFNKYINETTRSIDTAELLTAMDSLFNTSLRQILEAQNFKINSANIYEIYNERRDIYFSNILNVSFPIYIDSGRIYFGTIMNIERMPSIDTMPQYNTDTGVTNDVVHKYIASWTDIDGDLNIFKFKFISKLTPINEWTSERRFTIESISDSIEKVSKYQSSNKTTTSADGIPTIEYTIPEEKHEEYYMNIWENPEDPYYVERLFYEYIESSFEEDLLTASGLTNIHDVMTNLPKFNVIIKFETNIESGITDTTTGDPLYITSTQKLHFQFNKNSEDWSNSPEPARTSWGWVVNYMSTCMLRGRLPISIEIGMSCEGVDENGVTTINYQSIDGVTVRNITQ